MARVLGLGGLFGWFVDPEGNKVELWEPAAADRHTSSEGTRPPGASET